MNSSEMNITERIEILKPTVQKPLISTKVCYKVGLIKVRAVQAHCPACGEPIDNIRKFPNYCCWCSQKLSWNNIHIAKDEFLGYVDEDLIPTEQIPRNSEIYSIQE